MNKNKKMGLLGPPPQNASSGKAKLHFRVVRVVRSISKRSQTIKNQILLIWRPSKIVKGRFYRLECFDFSLDGPARPPPSGQIRVG